MDAETKAFAADVLESIKQAKRINSAQNSFNEHLFEIPKHINENVDEFEAKPLEIQPRPINFHDATSK